MKRISAVLLTFCWKGLGSLIDFIESVPIQSIQESVYNPRSITSSAMTMLQESLQRFGVVKPLIINNVNSIIVAGHQRRKAALSMGLTHLPCIKIKTPNRQDEIHFNLMHNSIETSQSTVSVEEFKTGGYFYCPADKIRVKAKPKNVAVCSKIIKLLSKYDEWGSVVVDSSGRVLLNAEYAYCAKKLGFGVLVYGIKDEDTAEFIDYLGKEYGKYNFDNLGIKTYHQFKAQLVRRSSDGRRKNPSDLYEKYLIPSLEKSDHIIDIGAGRMAYMKLVKSMGYDIHAYEPSLMTSGGNNLDMRGIVANILDAEKAVKDRGLFNKVVLEYVINSVVNNDFERAVLVLCNACTSADGMLFTSTRNTEKMKRGMRVQSLSTKRGPDFYYLDENNYSLSISNGVAFKQKFHTPESYKTLLEQFYSDVQIIACNPTSIYCVCKRPKQLSIEEYERQLEKELNIEYPNGFNKHKGLMNALLEKVMHRYG